MTFPTSNIANTVATGGTSTRPFIEIFLPRDPTVNDLNGNGGPYQVQQRWWNTASNSEWILVGFVSSSGVVTANWQPISGASTTETLEGNTGGVVGPDSDNNINVVGDGTSVTVTGDSGTNTLTISLLGGGFTWSIESTNFNALAQRGYFINGTATATLPASPTLGDTIKFFVDHATEDLTIQAVGTQIIRMGTTVSSAAGTAVSGAQGDSVELVYKSDDTCWCAVAGFSGTWILS